MSRPADGSVGPGKMGYQAVVWVVSTADMNLRVENSWTNPGVRIPPEWTGSLDDRLKLVHPDDRRAARERMEGLMSGEAEAAALELRVKVGGSYRWSLVRGSPSARDDEGRVTEVSGIWMDIDDLKRAEEELAASERRFRTFTDLSPVAVMIHRDGVWTYVNREAVRMTGYRESELIGSPFWRIVHPGDREMVRARGTARGRGENPPSAYQLRIVTREGRTRWADLRAQALQPEQGLTPVLVSAQDITDRKRVELTREVLLVIARKAHTLNSVQALYPAIQKALGSLFDTTNMIIALHDRGEDMLSLAYSSDQKDRFTSFPAGKTLTAYVIRTDRPLLVNSSDMDEMERRGLIEMIGTPSEVWMAAPLRAMGVTIGAIVVQSYDDPRAYDDEDLEVLTFVADQIGLFIDRARMVESLRENEELFRAVFETARDSIFVKDADLRYIRVNHAMEELFGLSRDDILGRTDSELFGPDLGSADEDSDARVLQGQVVEELPEKPVRGSSHIFHTVKVPLRSASGRITGICGIARDITDRRRAEEERKRLEQQVLEAQKMESLGIMAGGIAHDFNNILVAILGNAEIALEGGGIGRSAADRLEKIRSAALRASQLARQMLAYAGKASFQVEVLDLTALVRELFDIMRASIPRRIEIECRVPDFPLLVQGDPVQIRQVAMNLITNAAEAIEGAGSIAVSVSESDEDGLEPRGTLPDTEHGYVLLKVEDDGCGMESEHVERIFDPFFSTKFSGSGLGLSAVLGIMRSHEGTILVETEKDLGTCFTAVFPRLQGESGESGRGDDGACGDPGMPERVLVVDDERMVREVAAGMLEKLGCRVNAVESGERALDALAEADGDIGMVMLDLTMPGMDGEETFRLIRKMSPDLPVIVFSGYSREDLRRRFRGSSGVTFLQKPFTMDTLKASLNELTF